MSAVILLCRYTYCLMWQGDTKSRANGQPLPLQETGYTCYKQSLARADRRHWTYILTHERTHICVGTRRRVCTSPRAHIYTHEHVYAYTCTARMCLQSTSISLFYTFLPSFSLSLRSRLAGPRRNSRKSVLFTTQHKFS